MTYKEIIQTMRIKSFKAAVSFWGNFKFRGDSYLEMTAECPVKGWSLEEAKLAHLILSKEIAIECALDALTRGQLSKEQFAAIKSNVEKSFEKRRSLLGGERVEDKNESK